MNGLKIFLLAATLLLVTALTLSCSDEGKDEELPSNNLVEDGDSSSSDGGSSSSVGVVHGDSVDYGTEIYQTVVIGDQTWFARNLNYDVEGSRCYDDLDSNCEIYGRLYDWETALTLCPSGWHLPSDEEWGELIRFVEDEAGAEHYYNPHTSLIAGKYLTAVSNYSNDDYGFSALMGGWNKEGAFIRGMGVWWSAKESNANYADCWLMTYDGDVSECLTNNFNEEGYLEAGANKFDLLYVRCLKD